MCSQAITTGSPSVVSFQHLAKEEISNPHLVITDLFSEYHLQELREIHWEFLKATVTGSYVHALSREERIGLLEFYEHVAKLLEAAYLLKGDPANNVKTPE